MKFKRIETVHKQYSSSKSYETMICRLYVCMSSDSGSYEKTLCKRGRVIKDVLRSYGTSLVH